MTYKETRISFVDNKITKTEEEVGLSHDELNQIQQLAFASHHVTKLEITCTFDNNVILLITEKEV